MDSYNTCLMLLIFIGSLFFVHSANIENPEPRCMDSAIHKVSPLPENGLHKLCNVWKDNSCCTNETSVEIHNFNNSRMNKLFCTSKASISESCTNFFIQNSCLFECSPDLAPYIVKFRSVHNGKTEKHLREKVKNIPLCKKDCNDWFNSCAQEYINVDNVSIDSGASHNEGETSITPKSEDCQMIKVKFLTATSFCENMWNGAYKVVGDDEHCISFNGPKSYDTSRGNNIFLKHQSFHIQFLAFTLFLLLLVV